MDAKMEKDYIKGGAFLIENRSASEIFTPEDFSEEHNMIGETMREFIDNEVRPQIPEMEKHNWQMSRDLLRAAGELGLLGANIPEEYGGAVALGHPLGCTGAKLTATILQELKRRGGRYGMVTMCVGGGMGAAGIFERFD